MHILGSLHLSLEVEAFLIKADKARIATIQNTVNDEFDEVERTGWRTYISGIAHLATVDGDACLIGISLMRFNLADNHLVTNLFYSVLRYIFKLDDAERVCDFHSLVIGAF